MKQTKISDVKFVLLTELFEILWSSKNGIWAHVFRRATAASKGKDNFTKR